MKTYNSPVMKGIVFALFVLVYGNNPTGAQANDKEINARLMAVSADMMKDGNENFIIVETFRDGLLKPGYAFEFNYKPTVIKLNGIVLKGSVKKKYFSLMESYFISTHGGKIGKPNSWSLITGGDDINADSILNPKSRIRKNYSAEFRAKMKHQEPRKDYNPMILEMIKDGILTSKQNVDIFYSTQELTVNNQSLTPNFEKKYKEMFALKYGYTPDKDHEYLSIRRGPMDKN